MVVLGVNVSDDRGIALEYLKENKVTFPIIVDTTAKAGQVMAQYETLGGMTAVPMTYLIDREGKVVEAWYGYQDGRAEKALRKLGLK